MRIQEGSLASRIVKEYISGVEGVPTPEGDYLANLGPWSVTIATAG